VSGGWRGSRDKGESYVRRHRRASAATATRGSVASFGGILAAVAAIFVLSGTLAPLAAASTEHPYLEPFGSAAQPSFSSPAGLAVDQSTGDVYVIDIGAQTLSRYDEEGNPVEFSALGTNVIDGKNGADTTPQEKIFGSFGAANEVEVAIDESGGATDGNIYVTDTTSSVIDIFSSTGSYLGQLSESSEGLFGESCGVAVDSTGAVYTGDYSGKIHKFVPSGSFPVTADNTANFEYAEACNLAAGAGPTAGFIFASSYAGQLSKLDSSTGEVKNALSGSATIPTVDPSSGHVYAIESGSFVEFDASGSAATKISNTRFSGDGGGIAVRGATGDVYLSRSDSSSVQTYGPLFVPTEPPALEAWLSSVGYSEASINVAIDPESSPTTYRLEWGPSSAYGSETAEFEAGEDSVSHEFIRSLNGLAEGTIYHYRVVAKNPHGTTTTPDLTFTTLTHVPQDTNCPNQAFRVGAAALLPDCRGYEMVTPIDKDGVSVEPQIELLRNSLGTDQAAKGGEKLAYASANPFGDAVSNLSFAGTQYIASRGAGGWSSHAITPPHDDDNLRTTIDPNAVPGRYSGFNEDLSTAFLYDDAKTPLADGAVQNSENYYLRNNLTGVDVPITTQIFSGKISGMGFQGASADGNHVLVATSAALTPDALAPVNDTGTQLYDYTDGQLKLVSVLPGGAPTEHSSAGYVSPGSTSVAVSGERGNTRGAISADGSRIFWMNFESSLSQRGRLYARIDDERTVGVSDSVSPAADAVYQAAASDGSQVIFTEGEDLYRFDVDTETPTLIAGGVDPIHGVLGAGADASAVYFLSTEALATGAIGGQPNLYLDREGTKTFIATLSTTDVGGSSEYATVNKARMGSSFSQVTSNGQVLVFQSVANLTGYDSTSLTTGGPSVEIYRYDAESGELACVSCNPSGARPHTQVLPVPYEREASVGNTLKVQAAAWLPSARKGTYTPRMLVDDGRRVFFNAFDSLAITDTNGAQDVYEWIAQGTGGCTTEGGCVHLISTGTNPKNSTFIDASEGGRDVFFRTAASIDPDDPGLLDIYDARVDGGFERPASPPECVGDACQAVPAPPMAVTPASAGFHGMGNRAKRPDCRSNARKAAAYSRLARRLRRRAVQAHLAGRARTLRNRSAGYARRAGHLGGRARKCRRAARRAGR
jgi:hypothetical protein